MIVQNKGTYRPPAAFGDGLIQFPGDSKAAVAALDVDFRATDEAVQGAALPTMVGGYWSTLYAAWRAWADPVLDSWDYNPVGAAAFVKQSQIADWRAKLQQQQAAIREAGAANVPDTLASEQDKPFLDTGSLNKLLTGAIVLGILFVVVPRVLPKK